MKHCLLPAYTSLCMASRKRPLGPIDWPTWHVRSNRRKVFKSRQSSEPIILQYVKHRDLSPNKQIFELSETIFELISFEYDFDFRALLALAPKNPNSTETS